MRLCFRLLRLQWKQDIDEAARLITKAMQVDDKCEFAYETLGTIEVQRFSCFYTFNSFLFICHSYRTVLTVILLMLQFVFACTGTAN